MSEERGVSTRTLVESMLRADATIDTAELYDVAHTLGMTDQQVRLCVKRLVGEGQLVAEGRGRKAVLRATEAMMAIIEPDLEFIRYMYAQDRGQADWDGTWHVVAFAVPESARSARDAMRDAVLRLGGAAIQGGLYVSANPWTEHIRTAAQRLGVVDRVSTFSTVDLSVNGMTDPLVLAEQLWPIDRIADGYRRLLAVAERSLHALPEADRIARLRITIELAAAFSRAVEPDPLLPPALLQQPWVGSAARAVVGKCWSELMAADHSEPLQLFRWYADVVAQVTEPGE